MFRKETNCTCEEGLDHQIVMGREGVVRVNDIQLPSPKRLLCPPGGLGSAGLLRLWVEKVNELLRRTCQASPCGGVISWKDVRTLRQKIRCA